MKRTLVALFGIVFLAAACQKKSDLPNASFELDADPDRAFQAAVGYLESNGYVLGEVDSNARTVKTAPLQVEVARLIEVGRLGSEPQRYEMGRLTFKVTIEDRDGASRAYIDLKVSGYFRPKQTVGGGGAVWQEEASNGTLEKELLQAMK